jgi:putative transposase
MTDHLGRTRLCFGPGRWATRKVLSWRLSNTLDASFCVEALNDAIAKYDKPEIMNTDSHIMVTSSRVV